LHLFLKCFKIKILYIKDKVKRKFMAKRLKQNLEKQVIMSGREFGISMVLFRHAVGEKLGVNVTDMESLALIFFKGLATPTEIATHTGLSSGATTAMLDRLEKAGLIERKPNPQDRRGVLLVASQKRNKEVGAFFAPLREKVDKLNALYTQKELFVIADYLTKSAEIWEEGRKKLVEKKV
jgi:DNA-binding MarR family transcriptional regulator